MRVDEYFAIIEQKQYIKNLSNEELESFQERFFAALAEERKPLQDRFFAAIVEEKANQQRNEKIGEGAEYVILSSPDSEYIYRYECWIIRHEVEGYFAGHKERLAYIQVIPKDIAGHIGEFRISLRNVKFFEHEDNIRQVFLDVMSTDNSWL